MNHTWVSKPKKNTGNLFSNPSAACIGQRLYLLKAEHVATQLRPQPSKQNAQFHAAQDEPGPLLLHLGPEIDLELYVVCSREGDELQGDGS